VIFVIVFGALAVLSLVLLAWQALAASRFPLHRREADLSFIPSVTILKPLKGCDEHTRECLRSWLTQNYAGPVRVLFGVAEETDPACEVVRSLLREFPQANARLVITPEYVGPNGKAANVAQLYQQSLPVSPEELICVCDADVRVAPDFLANAVAPLRECRVGLVTAFYQLANPSTFAMHVEAVAINADFWSQVLQSNTLKPQDFALGAVMITRRDHMERDGGFATLAEYLADDYQLGNRVAKSGARVELAKIPVECWDPPMNFRGIWAHQVRWARTIRVSQPVPYFFSILNNVSLWATLFAIAGISFSVFRIAPGYPRHVDVLLAVNCLLAWITALITRIGTVQFLVKRLTGRAIPWRLSGAAIVKDFIQVGVWMAAFAGNRVLWRGRTFRVQRGGKLVEVK
jgi:ceramide glucosyltransferase